MLKLNNDVLKYIGLAVGKKDVRYYLNGIHFGSTEEGKLVIVATDSYRLHSAVVDVDAPDKQFTISAEDTKDLLSVKGSGDLTFEKINATEYRIGKRIVTCDYKANYPNYRRILLSEDSLMQRNAIPAMHPQYLIDVEKGLKLLGANNWYDGEVLTKTGNGDFLDAMQVNFKGTKSVVMGVDLRSHKTVNKPNGE